MEVALVDLKVVVEVDMLEVVEVVDLKVVVPVDSLVVAEVGT